MKELKDIVLKIGDVVYFEDDTAILQFDWENNLTIEEWNKARHSNEQIIKIERPIYETIYEAPKEILDKKEKKYLENFLIPFRKQIKWVAKNTAYGEEYLAFLEIAIKEYGKNTDYINMPSFKKDKYYKGMELNKEYTLDELRLFKE